MKSERIERAIKMRNALIVRCPEDTAKAIGISVRTMYTLLMASEQSMTCPHNKTLDKVEAWLNEHEDGWLARDWSGVINAACAVSKTVRNRCARVGLIEVGR